MINRDSLSTPVVKCQDEFVDVDLSRQKDLSIVAVLYAENKYYCKFYTTI